MKPVLFYLLQVLIASGLLYGYYHLALRNRKFHRYNRFYLLMTIVISVIIPFLNIPVYFSENRNDSSVVFETLQVISSSPVESREPIANADPIQAPARNLFTGKIIFYVLYFIIGSLVIARILISLNRLRQIIKRHPAEQFNGITFINTDEPGTPFSFFRWLFWNRKIELHSEKGQQIFRHEIFHIQQKHSWDIIFMEMVTIVFWINPFFYLVKKELKAIHEFLADEFAIKVNSNWQYAELLLMQALNTSNRLVNPFFHNQIKRRIAMITLSKKPTYQYLRKLMVLPIAVIIIFLFAFRYENKKGKLQDFENIVLIDQAKDLFMQDTTKPKPDTIVWIKDMPKPKKKTPTAAELKAWQDAKIYGIWIDSKRVNNSELKKYEPGDFGLFYVSKLYKNAVNYGKHYYEVCLYTLKYYDEKIAGANMRPEIFVREVLASDTIRPIPEQPLIVIDGKPRPDIKFSTIDSVIPVKNIRRMTMLKGKSAVDKYGNSALNGAIEIHTEKKVDDITLKEVILEPGQEIVKPTDPDNKIFSKVEVEPAFPGGHKEWRRYWERNLDVKAIEKQGCPSGMYTVVVQFIVHRDGHISDVKALTSHGFGMEEQAVRLISKGPYWVPGLQNGHNVTAYKKQPITFVIEQRLSDMNNTGHAVYAYLISPDEKPRIELADLKKVKQLKLQKTGAVETYELIGFRIKLDMSGPGKPLKEFVIKGNNFPDELLKIITELDSEVIIVIEDIDVKIDGRQKRLPPRLYTVVSTTTAPG